jgi:hypothetical protein
VEVDKKGSYLISQLFDYDEESQAPCIHLFEIIVTTKMGKRLRCNHRPVRDKSHRQQK